MADFFDATPYVRAPIITVQTGITLAQALVDACPKKPPANVAKACKHLKKIAEEARDQLAERNRITGTYTEEGSRVIDNEADRCWGGLRQRISAMAMLAPDKYPRAKRAAELERLLFAEGTEFLKGNYDAQSTAMAALLQRIADDALSADIDDIAGPEFLKAAKEVQPRYETMVSERLRRDGASGQNLAEIVRGLQAAIVNYATKIVGTIEHDDADTAEAARVALLPIANFRDAATVRAQRNAPEAAKSPAAPPSDTPDDA